MGHVWAAVAVTRVCCVSWMAKLVSGENDVTLCYHCLAQLHQAIHTSSRHLNEPYKSFETQLSFIQGFSVAFHDT